MIWRSKFSVSPIFYNSHVVNSVSSAVDVASCSEEEAIVSSNTTLPWRRHIQDNTTFRNLELDTLSNVKTTGKHSMNIVFLTSLDKNKTV